ncbi:MAG TPA: hypothetical protein VF732_02325 [Nitrospira sp.]
MTSDPPQHSLRTHPGGHRVFAQTVRYLLAPVIFLCSGFFTTNFFISGQYTWPRSSRALALTLTLLVLSYEFVYKEQKASGSHEQARSALVYSCVIPYALGMLVMLALWKL